MTEPLIDRDALIGVILRTWGNSDHVTDAVFAYLRSVLTPEALYPQPGMIFDGEAWATRKDMHRRIFGDT